MKVRSWGTRGSIPVSLTASQTRTKVVTALHAALDFGLRSHDGVDAFVDAHLPFEVRGTFGGHSSCVQLESDGAESVFLDFGSGARPLAGHYLSRFAPGQPQTYHVFMSHLHWDHIMGFPHFFRRCTCQVTTSSYIAAMQRSSGRFVSSSRHLFFRYLLML